MPRAAASRSSGSASDTPGEATTRAAAPSSAASNPPKRQRAAGAMRSSSARPGGSARLSVTASCQPRAARCRATDTPVRPSPTTSAVREGVAVDAASVIAA